LTLVARAAQSARVRHLPVSFLCLGLTLAAQAERPRLEASQADAPIVIDGRLTETAWSAAVVGTGFIERTPSPGVPAPAPTEVRVLHDASAIYVAVTAHLAPGEVPRGLEMTRDSFNVFSDDTITLKFDVHRDERSTIGLAVNAAGAQLDYIAVGLERRAFRAEFDAVWDAAVVVEPGRYTVEYRVPYVALGLSKGDGLIGFQVTRDHALRSATYDWAPMPPEFGPVAATHYGVLAGPRSTTAGHPVAVVPYISGEWEGDHFDQSWGGDLRARLGDDVWGELTFNTDFAEVDLDEARVNLDRFRLFFPEKRPFFLRGLDVFEFGARGAAQSFFSRRVGRTEPLWVGAKLYGRAGPVGFGVLDTVTDEEALTNTFVGRARVDSSGSGLGVIATHRAPVEDVADPTTDYGWGVDGTLLLGDARLALDGFYSGEARDLPGVEALRTGHAEQLQLRWRGDVWAPEASVRAVSGDYQRARAGEKAPLGFASRQDSVLYRAHSPWTLRFPETWLWTLSPVLFSNVYTPLDALEVETAEAGAELSLGLAGGWRLTSQGFYTLDEAPSFELAGALIVPAGRYAGPGASIGLQTPGTRNPGGSLSYTFRDEYYGGTLHSGSLRGRASLGAHARFDAVLTSARIELPDCGGSEPDCTVVTHAVNGGLRLAATPRLFANFNGAYDTVSEIAHALARLRWRYAPGSDLFVVYRHRVELEADTEAWRLTLKLAHRFDGLL